MWFFYPLWTFKVKVTSVVIYSCVWNLFPTLDPPLGERTQGPFSGLSHQSNPLMLSGNHWGVEFHLSLWYDSSCIWTHDLPVVLTLFHKTSELTFDVFWLESVVLVHGFLAWGFGFMALFISGWVKRILFCLELYLFVDYFLGLPVQFSPKGS